MEKFPDELTQADNRFLSRTSQGRSNSLIEEDEGLDWPQEITEYQRREVLRRLRKVLSRWKADAGGETIGEDYVIINKEEVDGGTLTSAISIHNLAMMFAYLILQLRPSDIRPYDITLEHFAKYSAEQSYGLEEYILKPNSFFYFLVEYLRNS